MQNKNLNFSAIKQVKCSSVKTENILSFDFCTHMCRKVQILILHGAKAIKISVSLTLSTVSFSYKSAENINLRASDAFFKEECFTFSKIGICNSGSAEGEKIWGGQR